MITGVYLVLFLTEPLITNSEYNNNIYLVLEYPKAVSLEVVFFVTLQMVLNLGFFDFMMVWKQYAFSRNQTSNFGFWSSAGLVICSTVLWWSWAVSHSQAPDHNQYSTVYCVSIVFWILCFGVLCLQNAHLCVLFLLRRGRLLLVRGKLKIIA